MDNTVYRVSGAGQYVGLDIVLDVAPKQYQSFVKSYYGVAVLIHGTEDFPQNSDKTTIAQPGCDVTIAIIPSVVVSEDAIREISFKKRNCYFDDEVDGDNIFFFSQ